MGDHIPRLVCLAFSYRYPNTNNIIEYEACSLGLEIELEHIIKQLEIFGDSILVLDRFRVIGRLEMLRLGHIMLTLTCWLVGLTI